MLFRQYQVFLAHVFFSIGKLTLVDSPPPLLEFANNIFETFPKSVNTFVTVDFNNFANETLQGLQGIYVDKRRNYLVNMLLQ